jgi:hypothetical protein
MLFVVVICCFLRVQLLRIRDLKSFTVFVKTINVVVEPQRVRYAVGRRLNESCSKVFACGCWSALFFMHSR